MWRILLKFADHQSSGFEENPPTKKILENAIEYRQRVTEFHQKLADFRNTTLKNYLQKTHDPLGIPLFNCVKWLWNLVSKPDLLSPKDFDSFIQQYDLPERQSTFLDRAPEVTQVAYTSFLAMYRRTGIRAGKSLLNLRNYEKKLNNCLKITFSGRSLQRN